jgi:nitrogen fixation protein
MAIPLSLLLAASHATAQSQDYPLTDAPVSTVLVTAPLHGVFVSPEQTDQVKGNYAMSNGWRLHVRPAARGIVARIDDERPMRLIAVSADRYVTADGNVAMEFNGGDFGDDMTMSYVPSSRVADVIVIRSTVAAR